MNNLGYDKLNNKLFQLYILSTIKYEKQLKNTVEDLDLLYPKGWDSNQDYKQKIEIIEEAIRTNTLIINTNKYQNILEGIEKIY